MSLDEEPNVPTGHREQRAAPPVEYRPGTQEADVALVEPAGQENPAAQGPGGTKHHTCGGGGGGGDNPEGTQKLTDKHTRMQTYGGRGEGDLCTDSGYTHTTIQHLHHKETQRQATQHNMTHHNTT